MGTSDDGLYRKALLERGTFFSLQKGREFTSGSI